MNYVKTNNIKHARVNLYRAEYYTTSSYNGKFSITFKLPSGSVAWDFANESERNQMLENLDAAGESQDISTITTL
jgi:hypothetical protein